MSPRGVLPAPARDSGVLRGGAGNHFSKGVPEFLEGTGVADLGKSRQNEDNVTFTPPGRERTPPIAPQLRQTQCLGGGKGEAPPLRLREERGLRESAWGWGWGALRHRVPARSGRAGRGGGADPPRSGPSPAAGTSPLILTRGGGARFLRRLWTRRAPSPSPALPEAPAGPPGDARPPGLSPSPSESLSVSPFGPSPRCACL